MLKSIGKVLRGILLTANVLVIILMLLCAFSPYINPQTFPVLSCAGLAFPIFLLLNTLFLIFWLIFYKRYTLLPLAAMFACAGAIRDYIPLNTQASGIPDDALKVLSYNVMAYNYDKAHTAKSPNEIVKYLQDSNADIICTQEAIFSYGNASKNLTENGLRKALSAYPYYSHYKKGANGWNCFSRYPILSTRLIDYESAGNGSIAYELKVGADTLLLINNHLESNKLTLDDKTAYRDMIVAPEEEKVKSTSKLLIRKIVDAVSIRAAQADSVAKYIREAGHKYVVVCGDFNDSPVSYTHRTISEGLNDAFIDAGNGLGISYNRNGFYFRIDHIMTSPNLEVYNCEVDRSIKASDHYPIWCYIRKK